MTNKTPKDVTDFLDDAILTLVSALKQSGVTELDEVCQVIGETLSIDPDLIRESLSVNPFVGEEPTFEDIITDAILGALPTQEPKT